MRGRTRGRECVRERKRETHVEDETECACERETHYGGRVSGE